MMNNTTKEGIFNSIMQGFVKKAIHDIELGIQLGDGVPFNEKRIAECSVAFDVLQYFISQTSDINTLHDLSEALYILSAETKQKASDKERQNKTFEEYDEQC